MNIDIYIAEIGGNRTIRIPWLPEFIECKSGGTVRATYDILDRGPVSVQTGTGLREYTWKSEFPGANRGTDVSMLRGTWEPPSYYLNILEDWRQKRAKLHLMVIGYPINLNVILDDYTAKPTGGFGDIEYELKFIEHRDIVIKATVIETPPKRPEGETASTTSYTVVSGDNLWDIATAKLGKGSRNKEIYNLNKDIIESTAKKYGRKSSNNGWWIYPGTVLKLPAK